MPSTRRSPTILILSCLIVAAALVGVVAMVTTSATDDGMADEPPALFEDDEVLRLGGADRFVTSALLASELWPDGANTVVLATGSNWPDALAGSPLAAANDAPLLLSGTDELGSTTRDALEALRPSTVLLMGGSAALSGALEQEVRDLPTRPSVVRVAGETRFETAEQASTRVADALQTDNGVVAIANGFVFPDALSVGALAGGDSPVPVLLATRRDLATPLGDASEVLLIGGTRALASSVERQAGEDERTVTRLAGDSRFSTSQTVADHALEGAGDDPVPLVLATGEAYPDALSAGAAIGRIGGVALLVPGAELTDAQQEWIEEHRDRFSGVIILGGSEAVSQETEDLLRTLFAEDD